MMYPAKWLLFLVVLWTSWQAGALQRTVLLEVDAAISPASSDYVVRGLQQAEQSAAGLVILQINTPGGLDSAMRSMVQAILASPVPVAGFVAPSGARAASAGTYILYACHIAAMAPGTNLGAATPVQLGTTAGRPKPAPGDTAEDSGSKSDGGSAMEHKRVNDAAAYLRSLAQLRGRNVDWTAEAVRQGASLSAREALDTGVIDLLAADVNDLLIQLDGYQVAMDGDTLILDTEDMSVVRIEPDWRTRVLSVIADPNITYILILIGVYGLIFELLNPGMVLPGVVGAISLLLALFALQVLPFSYAGLALLLLGIALMIAEAFAPSFGALGLGGLIAFVIGSVMLIDTEAPGYGISLPLILSFAAISGLFFLGVIGLAIRARRRPVVSGQDALVHASGTALEDFSTRGRVRVQGESWQAITEVPLQRGQHLRVTRIEGLTLHVEPHSED